MVGRRFGVIGSLSVLAFFLGCSGSVVGGEARDDGDGGLDARPDHARDATAEAPLDVVNPPGDAFGQDAFEEYVDPGCPDAAAPIFDYACDPLATPPGICDDLEACYPYVDYPLDPCGAEVYGSMCLPAGQQSQGDLCYAPMDCAAGFICVVSGSGNQCVQVCSLTDPSSCPNGRVCEPLDVAGYGGCL